MITFEKALLLGPTPNESKRIHTHTHTIEGKK